jgi:hypothetical protein
MTYSTIEQRTEDAPDTLGQKIRQSLRRIEINIVIGWFLLKVWLVKSLELEKKDDSVVRKVPTYRGRGDHELYIGPSVEELRLKAQSLAAVGLRNSSIPVSNVFLANPVPTSPMPTPAVQTAQTVAKRQNTHIPRSRRDLAAGMPNIHEIVSHVLLPFG